MTRIAAIDGDILCYECGFASDAAAKANGMSREPLGFCLAGVRKKIDAILKNTESSDYVVFLTGSRPDGGLPYREELYSEYKKNRDSSHKPSWYKEIKSYLISKHPTFVCVDGLEADDWLGIYATQSTYAEQEVVIASKDKDLDMIPGLHYNWSKSKIEKGVYTVTPVEGIRFFYKQMLTGDSTDNIPGIYKLFGRKATAKVLDALDKLDDADEMRQYVLKQYDNDEELFVKNGSLLWIRSNAHEDFKTFLETSAGSSDG